MRVADKFQSREHRHAVPSLARLFLLRAATRHSRTALSCSAALGLERCFVADGVVAADSAALFRVLES